jgi:hypothetical protein
MTYSSKRSGSPHRSPSVARLLGEDGRRDPGAERAAIPRKRHNGVVAIALVLAAAGWSACTGTLDGGPTTSSGGAGGDGGGSGAGQGGGTSDAACGKSPNEEPSVLRDECGVFVSEKGAGEGSEEAPLKSLAEAIALARSSKKNTVFACRGAYLEAVSVPAGVSLYGGLDCDNAEWAPRGIDGMERSAIQGEAGVIPLRLEGDGSGASIAMDGFSVTAAPAAEAGGSSIAAIAMDTAVVTLTSCDLIAGDGAPGAPGEDAPIEVPMSAKPTDANKGVTACASVVLNLGGSPHENTCENGEISIGGAGGQASTALGQSGLDGAPANPAMPQSGSGGTGDMACEVGKGTGTPGASGADGAAGIGAAGIGSISIDKGFTGISGGDGGLGAVGQGGGGGAGQKGKVGCAGASGGAGGAGGCGGKGGKGGMAGGSSIALMSMNASIKLVEVTLVAGSGGKGGNGGNAQGGGSGSAGSPGGTGASGLPSGCNGGVGGMGGKGGSGGGGSGGHALGIAFKGAAPVGDFAVTRGAKGEAGLGGNGNFQDNGGQPGEELDTLEFPQL